jgi:hypothetical protein
MHGWCCHCPPYPSDTSRGTRLAWIPVRRRACGLRVGQFVGPPALAIATLANHAPITSGEAASGTQNATRRLTSTGSLPRPSTSTRSAVRSALLGVTGSSAPVTSSTARQDAFATRVDRHRGQPAVGARACHTLFCEPKPSSPSLSCRRNSLSSMMSTPVMSIFLMCRQLDRPRWLDHR